MTTQELAKLLNGREYGEEINEAECKLAKSSGLVVLFGASDDLAEFRGAIYEEVGCYDGGEIRIDKDGPFDTDHECDCEHCGFKSRVRASKLIRAVWNKDGYSWAYKTSIPHDTFEIVEDGRKYCKGIVFEIKSLS